MVRLATARVLRALAAVFALALVATGGAQAEQARAAPSESGAQAPVTSAERELDADGVAEFFDQRVPELLDEQDVPGAQVAVVADGETLVAEGYGLADVAEDRPVIAEDVPFLVASVTKTVTAVAVMQLVDAGEVDLHTDVNEYLTEETAVADTYPGQEVSLHHLLTHSAGLEDSAWGVGTREPADVLTLHEYIEQYPAERVQPPGRFVAYSNHGTALAGLVVEQVSGQPFEEYVQEHVLDPLGMTASGLPQPEEAQAQLGAARQYHHVDGEPLRARTDYGFNATPVGGLYTTGPDFARFMAALLDDGQDVLSSESAAAMREPQFSAAPRMNGATYGMWELAVSGRTVLTHPGQNNGAHAVFGIVPEEDVGVFVAANGTGDPPDSGEDVSTLLFEEFWAEFLPAEEGQGEGTTEATAEGDASTEGYAGLYRTTAVSRSGPDSFFSLMDHVTVAEADGGALTVAGERWDQVEPGVFRPADGADRMTAVEEDGQVVGLGFDSSVFQNYERVGWWSHPAIQLGGLLGGLLLMASTLLWPLAALVRRLRGHRSGAGRAATGARVLAGATGLVCLGYAASMVGLLAREDVLEYLIGTKSALLVAPLTIALALALGVLFCAVRAWRVGWWGTAGRVHYTLVLLGAAAFLGVGLHHNLVWLPW